MQYMGSKSRIARQIIDVMLPYRKDGAWWVEPFVGSGSVIAKVSGNRIGTDANPYIIRLLYAVAAGWQPPDYLSEEDYYAIKQNPDEYPDYFVGFAAFGCSFGGKEWGGYARNNIGTNYVKLAKNSLLRIAEGLKGVIFTCSDYRDFPIPDGSLIYCDPPYSATTGYRSTFDSASFYNWCRMQASKGHTVFVSEYSAPKDFEIVWERELPTRLDKNRIKSRTEKLYRVYE